MKFSFTLICLGFVLLPDFCWSQNALPPQIRIRQTMDGLSAAGGISRSDLLYGIDTDPGRVLGDYYLDTKWNPSSMLMYGSEKIIEGYPVKYDIEGNAIEVKVGKQVKLIKVSQIESLIWYDSVTMVPRAFVNAKEYTEEGIELSGLLEVLVDGNIPLIKRTTIWVKRPDYVVAFDVGSKDTQINKREVFYYSKGKELFEIKKKKQLIELFGDKGDKVNRFIKVNQLNIKEQRGLVNAFLHYNSLISKE
ncbi:MAG: hypothetical protein KDC93_05915 [Cyclobacteriaceae bacterium]|nr:hypothetical protein [Cyclobacteriaceae bacterium]